MDMRPDNDSVIPTERRDGRNLLESGPRSGPFSKPFSWRQSRMGRHSARNRCAWHTLRNPCNSFYKKSLSASICGLLIADR